jgi:hypothetical protein
MNRGWGVPDYPDIAPFIRDALRRVGPESDGALLGVGASFGWPPRPLLLANSQRVEQQEDRPLGLPPLRPEPLSGSLREQLRVSDAPQQTVVVFVEPPEPMGQLGRLLSPAGRAIRCRMRGTLGPPVATRAGCRYLTAGHVAGPSGTQVHRIVKRRLLPTKYRRVGRVEFSTEPVLGGLPEYDVAALALDEQRSSSPCRVAHLSQFQASPINGTLLGGVSGRGHGLITGSLAGYGDADGRFKWANSWIMTPGEIGAEGDSGGPVTLATDEVLGILVGGSRVTGSKNFAQLYVQDLESIERDMLRATETGS